MILKQQLGGGFRKRVTVMNSPNGLQYESVYPVQNVHNPYIFRTKDHLPTLFICTARNWAFVSRNSQHRYSNIKLFKPESPHIKRGRSKD